MKNSGIFCVALLCATLYHIYQVNSTNCTSILSKTTCLNEPKCSWISTSSCGCLYNSSVLPMCSEERDYNEECSCITKDSIGIELISLLLILIGLIFVIVIIVYCVGYCTANRLPRRFKKLEMDIKKHNNCGQQYLNIEYVPEVVWLIILSYLPRFESFDKPMVKITECKNIYSKTYQNYFPRKASFECFIISVPDENCNYIDYIRFLSELQMKIVWNRQNIIPIFYHLNHKFEIIGITFKRDIDVLSVNLYELHQKQELREIKYEFRGDALVEWSTRLNKYLCLNTSVQIRCDVIPGGLVSLSTTDIKRQYFVFEKTNLGHDDW